MKNFLRYVLPILVILAVFAFLITRDKTPKQVVNDAVVSDSGSEELLDFLNSLADKQYENASQYVLENCETDEPYCLQSDLSHDEIVAYLESVCQTSYCEHAQIAIESESKNENVYTHYVSFLDDNSDVVHVCMNTACTVQKTNFGFRTVKNGDRWFIIDTPPTRVQ